MVSFHVCLSPSLSTFPCQLPSSSRSHGTSLVVFSFLPVWGMALSRSAGLAGVRCVCMGGGRGSLWGVGAWWRAAGEGRTWSWERLSTLSPSMCKVPSLDACPVPKRGLRVGDSLAWEWGWEPVSAAGSTLLGQVTPGPPHGPVVLPSLHLQHAGDVGCGITVSALQASGLRIIIPLASATVTDINSVPLCARRCINS